MRLFKMLSGAAVVGGMLAASSVGFAADQAKVGDTKSAKPYSLKTCIVSGEKLGGDMGKPYVFVHQGQEIKLCCKGCLNDFNKEPAKYLKKLADAQKRGKEQAPGAPAQDHSGHAGHQH